MVLHQKYVPTDMDWHPTFAGNFVCVQLIQYHGNHGYKVRICGGDDTEVECEFTNEEFEEALELFNKTNYLQSHKDLVNFPLNNGFPSQRRKFEEFNYERDLELENEEFRNCSWWNRNWYER